MTRRPLQIRDLVDVPEVIPILVAWYVAEWEPHYGEKGAGDAETDLVAATTSRERLPVCLVAFDAEGMPLGTASLKTESLPSHRHLSPWITALLVSPHERRHGVATELLGAVERQAAKLGFELLYVATNAMRGYLENRGYERIGEAPTLRERTAVHRLRLA